MLAKNLKISARKSTTLTLEVRRVMDKIMSMVFDNHLTVIRLLQSHMSSSINDLRLHRTRH